jgi:coproporphyrinogen III oxidase
VQDGNVWEKAGVNVSVVYGSMPADAYRAAVGKEDIKGLSAVGMGRFQRLYDCACSVYFDRNAQEVA